MIHVINILKKHPLGSFMKNCFKRYSLSLGLYSLTAGVSAGGVMFFLQNNPSNWGFGEMVRILFFFLLLALFFYSRFRVKEYLAVVFCSSLKDLKLELSEALISLEGETGEYPQRIINETGFLRENTVGCVNFFSLLPVAVILLFCQFFSGPLIFFCALAGSLCALFLHFKNYDKTNGGDFKQKHNLYASFVAKNSSFYQELKFSEGGYDSYTDTLVDLCEEICSDEINEALPLHKKRGVPEAVLLGSFGIASLLLTAFSGTMPPDVVKASVGLLFYYFFFYRLVMSGDSPARFTKGLVELDVIKTLLKSREESFGEDPLPQGEPVLEYGGGSYRTGDILRVENPEEFQLLSGLIPGERVVYNGVAVQRNSLLSYREKCVYLSGDSVLNYGITLDIAEDISWFFTLLEKREMLQSAGGVLDISSFDCELKGLASLLECFLPGKEIFLLRGWCEKKEPRVKELFYREIIPRLRERGIVILSESDDAEVKSIHE